MPDNSLKEEKAIRKLAEEISLAIAASSLDIETTSASDFAKWCTDAAVLIIRADVTP